MALLDPGAIRLRARFPIQAAGHFLCHLFRAHRNRPQRRLSQSPRGCVDVTFPARKNARRGAGSGKRRVLSIVDEHSGQPLGFRDRPDRSEPGFS